MQRRFRLFIRSGTYGTMRPWLGALQRGGLFGAESQPGKRRKLEYGPDQFHRLVLTFELIELGIVPSIILPLIENTGTACCTIFA